MSRTESFSSLLIDNDDNGSGSCRNAKDGLFSLSPLSSSLLLYTRYHDGFFKAWKGQQHHQLRTIKLPKIVRIKVMKGFVL